MNSERSLSSHSLHKNGVHHPVSKLFSELLDSENGPVRKAYSTGDLQRINYVTQRKYHRPETTLSSESNMIIVGMSRACRYSPEEKKERIERYRRRKNQRNFNKKIKYACRKTLADSRPRIRGRFARNEEIEIKNNTPIDLSHMDIGEEEEDDNWINFLDAFSANLVQ
ncbi:zinc finger protein CONSTANS-like [Quillaja saponaria]|uniref:Zinc finger protein CONSTANS-like n=1 Tax=Quillaja saponaria TaxID=32244 RepID=A0AAD7QGA3_QUISA|nr:zinc finger protein CONSTANS-like [Quillaja saponaria]